MADVVSVGALEGERARRRKTPDDLKGIGFTGIAGGERTDPPLSSIRQDSVEKGRLAAEMALGETQGDNNRVLETSLLVRGSTR